MAAVCPATDAGPRFLQSIGSTDLKCKAFLLVKEEQKNIPAVRHPADPSGMETFQWAQRKRGKKLQEIIFVEQAKWMRRPFSSAAPHEAAAVWLFIFFFISLKKISSSGEMRMIVKKGRRGENPTVEKNMEKIIITTIAWSLGRTLFFHPECFRLPFRSFYWTIFALFSSSFN